MEEARSRDIAIPSELAVIGFGDLEFARHMYPPISTVRVDRAAIGLRAAELILARMDGQNGSSEIVDVGFEVIDRGTT